MTHVRGTTPYPWPYDGGLDAASLALVVCGAQHRFVDTAVDAPGVRGRLRHLAGAVRRRGGKVAWVRHGRRAAPGRHEALRHPGPRPSWLPIRGTPGWELVERPAPDDVVVDASGWDGCYASDLDHDVRTAGARYLVLGGFASEVTVDSTVRTLNDRGHECLVLTDGCAPLDSGLGARAHHSLTMSGGIFGALGTVDDLLSALEPHALRERTIA